MKIRTRIVLLSALVTLAGLSACSTNPPATAGGASIKSNNVTGTVSTQVEVGVDAAYMAARAAVDEMRFYLLDSPHDALSGHVNARTADDDKITVDLSRVSDRITTIDVNAGGPTKTAIADNLMRRIQTIARRGM
ncbi:hypothetical protein BH11PLA1_BH11PLA1_08480 [soil metagenome]